MGVAAVDGTLLAQTSVLNSPPAIIRPLPFSAKKLWHFSLLYSFLNLAIERSKHWPFSYSQYSLATISLDDEDRGGGSWLDDELVPGWGWEDDEDVPGVGTDDDEEGWGTPPIEEEEGLILHRVFKTEIFDTPLSLISSNVQS